jgi:RNA polymerase sigma factor (sigma-70 family)
MILSNVRLVASIASKYSGNYYEDLFQEGIFGLEKALDKFNPDEKNKFVTYATWWVRQAVTRAYNDLINPVKVPVNKEENVVCMSIDTPLNEDGFTLEKILSDVMDVEEDVMEKDIRERVAKGLGILNRYEKKVILMKYYKGLKNKQIAQLLKTKVNYVAQIERDALRKLRSVLMDLKE